MAVIRKIPKTSLSLKTIINNKQRELKQAQAIASELRTQKMFEDAAKSMMPCSRLHLQMNNSGDEFIKNKKFVFETPIELSDSDWAPWSISYKRH